MAKTNLFEIVFTNQQDADTVRASDVWSIPLDVAKPLIDECYRSTPHNWKLEVITKVLTERNISTATSASEFLNWWLNLDEDDASDRIAPAPCTPA